MKTLCQIGDTNIILEEITCIEKEWGEDANRISVNVWLRNAERPVKITIRATGDQVRGQSDGHDTDFMNKAHNDIDKLTRNWALVNHNPNER
jgi:hypothetical protein